MNGKKICEKKTVTVKMQIIIRNNDWQAMINKLVYLNGNNAAEGENNIKYANSYPMN